MKYLALLWLFGFALGAAAGDYDFHPRELRTIARNGTDITEDPVALALQYGIPMAQACQVFETGDHLAFLDEIAGQETPHLDWAAPHARKLRVLAIGNHADDVGNFIQLRQRTDWDWTLRLWPRAYLTSNNPSIAPLFGKRLEAALAREFDVIFISAVATEMPPAVLQQVLDKAKSGVGIVMVNNVNQWWRYPKETLAIWNGLTPIPFAFQTASGELSRSQSPLAQAFVPATWPPLGSARNVLAKDVEPVLSLGPHPIVAVRGNVVGFNFSTNQINRGLLPAFDAETTPRFDDWWEPVYAFYLKALLTAAGYRPPLALQIPEAAEVAAGVAPTLTVTLAGAGKGLLRWRCQDPWGQPVGQGRRKVAAGPVRLDLPACRVNGVHRLDLWLERDGKILDFGCGAVRVTGGPDLAVARVEPQVVPGQVVHYRVTAPAGELRSLAIDDQDRVFYDQRQTVDGTADIAVATVLSALPHNIVRFDLIRDGQVIARQCVDLVLPRLGIDSLAGEYCIMTYGATNVEPQLDRYIGDLYRQGGFNTIYLNWHSRAYIRNAAMQGQFVSSGAMSPYMKQTGFEKELKNFPLKEEVRAEWSKNIATASEDMKTYGGIGRVLDDESYIAHTGYDKALGGIAGAQACQSVASLAEFRRRLAAKYGDIARLNAEWGTAFAGFADVRMIAESEVRDSDNPAGWIEFRDYMNDIYAREYYGWMQAQHAALGDSFGVGPGAPGFSDAWSGTIYRGGDYEKLLPCLRYIMAYGGCESRVFADAFCGQPGAQKYDPPLWWREWGPWKYLFDGADALWFYASRQIIGHELSWRKHAEWAAEGVRDIVAGAGPLVRDAQPLNRAVRILWSTRNTGLAWLWTQRQDAWAGLGLKNGTTRTGATFESLLREQLFIQPSYITETQIAGGDLADCRLLILPQAVALGDDSIAAIRQFVAAGGTVVADILPGTRTAMGAPRTDAPLAVLFGVDVRKAEIHRERETWYSVGAARDGLWKGQQLWLPADTTFRGIEATTARVDGKMLSREGKESQTLFVNETGNGRTLLLNFVYCDLRTDTLDWHLVFGRRLLEWAGVKPPAQIVHPRTREPLRYRPLYAFRRGTALLLGSVSGRSIWSGGKPVMIDDGAAFEQVTVSRFLLPAEYHVYDVRTREYRGRTGAVDVPQPSFHARLLALLPYKVEGIEITAPKRAKAGTMLTVAAKVRADDPGEHVLRMDVYSPTGHREPLYCRTLPAPAGRAEFTLTLALNDRPGRWRVVVHDALSGVENQLQLEVVP